MADIEKFFKTKRKNKEDMTILEDQDPSDKKNINFSIKKFFKIFAISLGMLIFLGASGTSIYFYKMYKRAIVLSQEKKEIPKSEQQILLENVGKLMELPNESDPTIATVTDKSKLLEQDFFRKAENGDKIIIYTEAKRAILYRPNIEKIIDVAMVNVADKESDGTDISGVKEMVMGADDENSIQQEKVSNVPLEEPTEPERRIVRVAVFNGGNIKNLAADIAQKISSLEKVEIINKDNAKSTYAKTIVVDLTGGNDEVTKKIIETIGGEIGALPAGEARPEADILIIGGKNQLVQETIASE